ncbi:MAG: fumarylacetoacetate hydrolase family protein [Planctomycetota bacterium]
MKLATYRTKLGDSYGVVVDDGLIDVRAAWGHAPPTLLAALQAGGDALGEIQRRTAGREPTARLDDVHLLAPIPHPPKVIGLAGNYVEHHREFDRGQDLPDDPRRKTTPRPFLMPHTAVTGPDTQIPWPAYSEEIDYEVELAAIIGRPCKSVPPEQAAEYVAGYTIANDVSARSVTHADGREQRPKDPFFDWLHGKWADNFCPLGPWMVTADEIGDPQDLTLQTYVDGELRQDACTDQMIFSVYDLVAFCSQLMTLTPGDVIATGTPSGVGKATGKLLTGGSEIRCRIDRIGELANTLGQPPEQFYAPCR